MKSYENERQFVESLLNNKANIHNIQEYIKENYNTNSIYDNDSSVLYVWNEGNNKISDDTISYINENIDNYMVEVDYHMPDDTVFENNKEETVFAVYFEDGIMYNYFFTKQEAEEEKKRLEKECPANKPTIKEEPITNFIKQ